MFVDLFDRLVFVIRYRRVFVGRFSVGVRAVGFFGYAGLFSRSGGSCVEGVLGFFFGVFFRSNDR